MPAAVLPESAFKGRKVGDSFAPKKKGAGKGKGSGAPKKFTGKMGNITRPKSGRRAQVLTAPPMKSKGAAVKPGKKKVVGHSMGGLFGVQPKRTEPENRPPKQSEKYADRAARIGRLKNLLI